MAESGLSLTIADLRTYLTESQYGADGDYTALTTAEKARVDRMLTSGLRQFYYPEAVELQGRLVAHTWSFLEIVTTLTHEAPYSTGTITIVDGVVTGSGTTFPSDSAARVLSANGQDYSVNTYDSATQVTLDDLTVDVDAGTSYTLSYNDYTLPDDFGHMVEDSITYAPSELNQDGVRLVGEGRIRELRQSPATVAASHPWLAAVRPKVNVAGTGSRHEILFWPNVAEAAIVSYRYKVRPPNETSNYVYGASDHSETIKSSCLAAAERMIDGQRGVEHANFLSQLKGSILRDRRAGAPHFLGRMSGTAADGPGRDWHKDRVRDYVQYTPGP